EALAQRRRDLAELREDRAALGHERAVTVGLESTERAGLAGARAHAERLEHVLGEPLGVVHVGSLLPPGPARLAPGARERDRDPTRLDRSGVATTAPPVGLP